MLYTGSMRKINQLLTGKKFHLLLILAGALAALAPLLHTHLWFDESYSVAISRHGFAEIWSIGSHDVHPVLYYFLLHVLYLVFPSYIAACRLFSWLCLVLLGLFGYTHVRKSFGEGTGVLFSFFVLFFPVNIAYAGEIRMYTLVMLLVTLAAYWAWRIHEGQDNAVKPWVFMSLFTIAASYTHYYGLLASAVINLFLLAEMIWDSIRMRAVTPFLRKWFLFAAVQILAYVPWLLTLLSQMSSVKNSFWITFTFPWTVLEMASFQVSGNLDGVFYVPETAVWVFLCLMLAYLLFCGLREGFRWCGGRRLYTIGVYIGVLVIAAAASAAMDRMVVYARYLLVCTGLLFLYMADVMVRRGTKVCSLLCCAAVLVMSGCAWVTGMRISYDPSNSAMYDLVSSEMEPGDAVLVCNWDQDANSFIAASQFPNHPLYYWNVCEWNDESVAAYRAYSTDMKMIGSLSELSGFHGRIWLLYGDGGNQQYGRLVTEVTDQVSEALDTEPQILEYLPTVYKNIQYTVALYDVQ